MLCSLFLNFNIFKITQITQEFNSRFKKKIRREFNRNISRTLTQPFKVMICALPILKFFIVNVWHLCYYYYIYKSFVFRIYKYILGTFNDFEAVSWCFYLATLKQYLFAQRLPPDFMVMTFSQLLSPLHHMPLGIWDSLMILPMGVCGWLKKHVPGPLPIIVFSTIAIIFLQLFGDDYFLDIEEEIVTGFQKQKKNF